METTNAEQPLKGNPATPVHADPGRLGGVLSHRPGAAGAMPGACQSQVAMYIVQGSHKWTEGNDMAVGQK